MLVDRLYANLISQYDLCIKEGTIFWYNPELKIWVNPTLKSLITNKVFYDTLDAGTQKCVENPFVFNELVESVSRVSHNVGILDRLDTNRLIFPIHGGKVVDIISNKVRDRTKEDYCSFFINVNYLENHSLNEGEQYLKTILTDEDCFHHYISVLANLLFNLGDKPIVIMYGKGNNGKTGLIDIIEKILGPYIVRGYDTVGVNKTRVVHLPECDLQENGGTLKCLCANLYKMDQQLSTNKFKILIDTNESPYLTVPTEVDNGLWSQIEPLEFKKTFDYYSRDPQYVQWVKDNCLDQIFTIFVDNVLNR